jgi:putative hemin transport protein
MQIDLLSLKENWFSLQAAEPKLRIRDAAERLGVSELELLLTGLNQTCHLLEPDIQSILKELPKLGEVMALTRIGDFVHEVIAPFGEYKERHGTFMFFRPGQDTRYFIKHWKYAVAVSDDARNSIQFFNSQGEAVHKIHLKPQSNIEAYEKLVRSFKARDQSRPHLVSDIQTKEEDPSSLDPDSIREDWSNIKDVHQGNVIIRKNGNQRQKIYRLLGSEYTHLLDSKSVEGLLSELAKRHMPLMLFIMNCAAVQSFSGTIDKIVEMGPWFNILDKGFNLHMKSSEIGEVWLVGKPSKDGWVTSLDIFDKAGNEVMVITDQRGSGQSESPQWTELLNSLPSA